MDRNKDRKEDNIVEEMIEEFLVDPDSPENSDAKHPPQTIDAEPTGERKR